MANTRRFIIQLTILLTFIPLLNADVKISNVSGNVTIIHNGQPSDAKPGSSLELKDRVKTGDSSRAVLVMDNATRIWVAKNSDIEITSTGNESLFSLLMGKIRAKVKLAAGGKFSVKTPVSVASVRGTEFVADSEGLLAVIEGKVNFSDLSHKQQIEVIAGFVSIMKKDGLIPPREMTRAEKEGLEKEWKEFGGAEQGSTPSPMQNKKSLAEMRNDLRNIVNDIKNGVNTAREMTNEIKEADIATGRTLRDVNGNVVRTEQYLLRPDNQTFEVLNLTKRTNYNYVDRNNWGFNNLPNKSRLDVADVKVTMNMGLPEQLSEWPSFMSSNSDNLHPQKIDISLTNQSDTMEMIGKWGLQGIDLDEKGKLLTQNRIVMQPYIDGWAVDTTYVPNPNTTIPGTSFPQNGNNATDLRAWNISSQERLTKNGQPDKYVYVYTEAYGINNNGNILSLNDFTSTSQDPFTVLKQVAAESIVFVRNDDSTKSNFLSTTGPGNLDLVTTPDLIVSVAEKIGSEISDLTNK